MSTLVVGCKRIKTWKIKPCVGSVYIKIWWSWSITIDHVKKNWFYCNASWWFKRHKIFMIRGFPWNKLYFELGTRKVWLDYLPCCSQCLFFGHWCFWLRNSRATFLGWRHLRFCTTCRRIAGTQIPIHFIQCWNKSCGKLILRCTKLNEKHIWSNQWSCRDPTLSFILQLDVFGIVDSLNTRFQGALIHDHKGGITQWHIECTKTICLCA